MIKKIKNSLTVKICILTAALLMLASAVTYGAVVGVLPTYYSSQLQKELDQVSGEIADTISSYKTIEEAFYLIDLFEARSQVNVTILDDEGAPVRTTEQTVVEEDTAAEGMSVTITETDVSFTETASAIESDTVQDDTVWERPDTAGEWDGSDAYDTAVIQQEESAVDSSDAVQEGTGGDAARSAVKQYSLKVGGKDYTMLVSGGMQQVNQALDILYQIIPYILAMSLAAAILFALLASFYLTAPVVRLSRLAGRMASLDFSSEYQGKRTDEIGQLGSSLNMLSANLSEALGDLRQANEKLQSDIEKERELEKSRIAFFSAVSHELKTPITILKGHLTGMLQGIGEYRNRDYYLQRALQTTEKMEDMVKELLTISRMEKRSFITREADVAEVLRQQAAEMTELIEQKGIVLLADIPEHLHARVNPGMMEKVFRNLLMNAIRYTPKDGENQIRITLKEQTSGFEGFFCFIENTGVFIPEEALPHLFEAFYRVEQSRNRETGGSGLGLYIVKMILDQHGAKYRMENTKEGVRFSFFLQGKNT